MARPQSTNRPPQFLGRRRLLRCLAGGGLVLWGGIIERGGVDRGQDAAAASPENAEVTGDAVIRAPAGKSEIVITTTRRLAGAIHSLRWNGQEFIDSADHGRQLQSAVNLDGAVPFVPEVFNPTEAGSRRDGAGETSSSRLLFLQAEGRTLRTRTRMAFWLAPGEKSEGHPALNDRVLSNHVLEKTVTIGVPDFPQAMRYETIFTVPKDERHTLAQFEAVTGYMPPEFERFWKLLPDGQLAALDDGPGEQSRPVILATANGEHAMGVFSPDQPSAGFEQAGYGRFRFREAKVNKWNCVFRVRRPEGIEPGEYRFLSFVAVGTLDDVRTTLAGLEQKAKR